MKSAQTMGLSTRTFVLAFLFFVSGFSALVYQITWQRLLALFSGLGHYTITVIVTAFMAGLGIGSYLSGFYADRISRRKSILSFAACEICIAFFALLSPILLYDLVYMRFGFLAKYTGAIPVIHFTVLFLPTFLMGASLPLLSKGLVTNIDRASQTIGILYGLNTLGAGVGSLASVYLLLPKMSIPNVIYLAAALNAAIGLLVIILYRKSSDEEPILRQPECGEASVSGDVSRIEVWFGLAFIAGFVALAYEIVWFRTLWVALKVNPQTFGSVLGILLSCMGIGSLIGICVNNQFHSPKRVYLLSQWLTGIAAGTIILWFCYGSKDWGYLKKAFFYWAGYDFVREEILKRISEPYVQDYFKRSSFQIKAIEASIKSATIKTYPLSTQKLFKDRLKLNTDLFPQNEFLLRYPDLLGR